MAELLALRVTLDDAISKIEMNSGIDPIGYALLCADILRQTAECFDIPLETLVQALEDELATPTTLGTEYTRVKIDEEKH